MTQMETNEHKQAFMNNIYNTLILSNTMEHKRTRYRTFTNINERTSRTPLLLISCSFI
ncbi:hypothetical protein HanRHA438_Chr12g0555971 [Helianthus annuus]|nr:hypothetical protein HanRHA438_Chr12g0555971 [Helianthus annuus]